jgi:hypothetical protein
MEIIQENQYEIFVKYILVSSMSHIRQDTRKIISIYFLIIF